MNSPGSIIYITGLLGAGKTTLINATLADIAQLRHMPVYITRPLRPYELDPRYETTHVTHNEYEELRAASKRWDHTEVLGNWYGADAERINHDIDNGQWFIISSPIEIAKLEAMKDLYAGHGTSTTIWIDTSLKVSNVRLLERDGGSAYARIADHTQSEALALAARDYADIIFKPSGSLERDRTTFVSTICEMIDL